MICSVEGCELIHKAKGYCNTHYRQHLRGKTPGVIRKQRGPVRKQLTGLCLWADCSREQMGVGLCKKHYTRLWLYNLTLERYTEMLDNQNGLCANPTCTNVPDAIDHDHACCEGERSCGECVVGLLCRNCNAAEGLLGSDSIRILGLAEYVIQTRNVEVTK